MEDNFFNPLSTLKEAIIGLIASLSITSYFLKNVARLYAVLDCINTGLSVRILEGKSNTDMILRKLAREITRSQEKVICYLVAAAYSIVGFAVGAFVRDYLHLSAWQATIIFVEGSSPKPTSSSCMHLQPNRLLGS